MTDEKQNLADIMPEIMKEINIKALSQEDWEQIRTLFEKLREYHVGRREYGLPSPFARRRIRIGRAEEPDPRTIKLSTIHR
jgi:hypothetical protein